MVRRVLIAVLLIGLGAWPPPLRAQQVGREGGSFTTISPPTDTVSKSPEVAGALGFLVPFGAGSFYAGNLGHGVRHLTIGAGALLTAGIANHRLSRNDAEEGAWLVLMGAGVAFLVNWIWGTAAAVEDAQAFNRRHSLLPESKMSLHIAPVTDGAARSGGRVVAWVQIEF